LFNKAPCVTGTREDILYVKTGIVPILRGLYDVSIVHKLESLIKEPHMDISHVNMVDAHHVNPLVDFTYEQLYENEYVICFVGLHNSWSNVVYVEFDFKYLV